MARIEGPLKLVYTSRPLTSQSEARKNEIEVKKWTRAKKNKLVAGEISL